MKQEHPLGAIICRKTGREYRNYIKVRKGTRNGLKNFEKYAVWLMERKLRRKLRPNEVVHHKNGNKLDDREENLELTTRAEHTSHHIKGAEKTEIQKQRYIEKRRLQRLKKVPLAKLKALMKYNSLRECSKYFDVSWVTFLKIVHEDYNLRSKKNG